VECGAFAALSFAWRDPKEKRKRCESTALQKIGGMARPHGSDFSSMTLTATCLINTAPDLAS
jgi:hypothetical protein